VLSQGERERQGQAVRTAHAALGTTEAVRAFLNSPHAELGGRPIDLALASDEGLAAVEAAIAEQAKSSSRKPLPPRAPRAPRSRYGEEHA
jgi:hypothetical protein